MKKLISLHFFAACLGAMLLPFFSIAQTINVPPNFVLVPEDDGLGNTIQVLKTITPIPPGASEITIDFNVTPPGSETWSISSLNCANSPCPITSANINVSNGQLSFTPTAENTIQFNLTVSTGGGASVIQRVRIIIGSKPIDYAFVLDKSGSMAWAFDGSFSPAAGQRRWDGLVTGVGLMASKLVSMTRPDDQVGIRYFQSVAETPPSGVFNGNLISLPTNAASIQGEVTTRSPGGGTALGNGMIAGRDLLLNAPANAAHRKVMIIFSDGDQNAGNQVNGAIPTQTLGTPIEDLNGPTDQIEFYTICLGSGTGFNSVLMQGIAGAADKNLTISSFSDVGNPATAMAFDNMANKILINTSPQFVGIRNGKYRKSGSTFVFNEKFIVNKSVDQVLISLVSPTRNEPIILAILKDSVNLLQYAQRQNGKDFQTYSIKFPIPGLPKLRPDGAWEVLSRLGTTPRTPPDYYLSFTVDDHLIDVNYSLGGSTFETGQTLKPGVTLKRLGTPIKNATIKATVLTPIDIGDFIARSGGKFPTPDPKDPGSPGEQKLAELLKDSTVANKLKGKENAVSLTYNPASESYTGTFAGLAVSGTYQVLFTISSTDPVYGRIERYEQMTFNVIHTDISEKNSSINVTTKNGQTLLTIRPQTSTGIFWGPGWASSIKVDVPGTKVSSISDKGDGTYEVLINGDLKGTGTISVGGKKLVEGNMSKLKCNDPNASIFDKILCWFKRL